MCSHSSVRGFHRIKTIRNTSKESTIGVDAMVQEAPNKRTILLVTEHYPPEIGSAAHLFADLATGLSRKGYEVGVITTTPRFYNLPSSQEPINRNEVDDSHRDSQLIKVNRVRTPKSPKNVAAFRGLEMFLDALLMSISITWSLSRKKTEAAIVYSPPLPLAFLCSMIGRLTGVPVISNIQDLYPKTVVDTHILRNKIAIRIFTAIEKATYRMSTAITVHSKGNMAYIQQTCQNSALIRVIHNSSGKSMSDSRVTNPNHEPPFENLKGKFVVTYAGVMAIHQGLDVVVEAANILRNESRIAFLLVGDGMDRDRIASRTNRLNLHNMTFMPFVEREEYNRIIVHSDAVLVTLDSAVNPEVVPGKIQSIMSLGIPIIASLPRDGDAWKIIQSARCGICCEAGDASQLSNAVRHLSNNRREASEFGQNGFDCALSTFSIEAFTDSYESILSDIRNSRMANGS